MSVQRRRKFDSDFKRNVVLLSQDPNRSAAEVAENLGISKELLYGGVKSIVYGKDLPFQVTIVRY